MDLNNVTVEDINNMTPEERTEFNKAVAKTFAKHIAKRMVVVGGVALAAHLAVKKMMSSEPEIAIETHDTPVVIEA
jgi:hypothetical protein